jgi:hypothetical protein
MEKHKLLSLVKKTSNYFDDYSSPNSVYQSLWNDNHFKPLLDKMTSEDIIFYSFLVPINNKDQDIDETYDRIETNMYTIELIEIYNTEPEVDCPECRNGYKSCDNCDGTGETQCGSCDGSGEEDCRYCGGSGMDEDAGEECDMCEGDGKQTCEECNGTKYESCRYCGGDGEVDCYYCDSTGNIFTDDKVEIQYLDYISWSPRWKNYFFRAKPEEQLDYEDTKNFGFNPQTILLGMSEEITEEYLGYENGDVLLYVTKDTKDINLTKTNERILL